MVTFASEGFFQPGQPFNRVVVVGRAGLESQIQIKAVRGGHGGGSGVKVNSFAAGSDSAIENGLREHSTQRESARRGAHPQALELPGVGGDGDGESAPGDEARGIPVGVGHEAAAALFEVAMRKPRGFKLKCAEAEAGRAGLSKDEAAVFKQQLTGLGERAFGLSYGDFTHVKWRGCGFVQIHGMSLRCCGH